ncbi:MAG: hypothetical protein AB1Z98_03735 [Nannocystaceae bacterium]
MSSRRLAVVAGLAWALGGGAGCGGSGTDTPRSPEPGTGTGTGSDSSAAGSSTEADSSGTEPEDKLDLPPPVEMTCDKIDFLFVIDNSGSMSDEQERLIDGFPGFIAGIEESIAQYDYHLMVVTVDAAPTGAEDDPCDQQFGAGRVIASDGTECGLPPGQRYADTQTEDLTALFECVADVGTEGSGQELPIWGMAQAITEQNLPGGCNEGFLRDDAILVVTVISDEEDDEGIDSPGGPQVWKDVVVSAKNGDETAVVMLGLVGDTDLRDGVCQPFDMMGGGAEGAPRLREFIESFSRGSWASVCLDDFVPFFNDAVIDVGEACEEFVPPG